MAHFAQLDENNKVLQVLVVNNDCICDEHGHEHEEHGCEFFRNLFGEDTCWKQCSYNGNLRGRYPAIGSEYLPDTDVFTDEQPYPSWILNREDGTYHAPTQPPEHNPETQFAFWEEESLQWVIVDHPTKEA